MSATSAVFAPRPPPVPRVAMLRMNTPSSLSRSAMRTRSPSSAPEVKGLVGSTATIATL